ncbi:MAG: HAMP domain-containing protein [Ruminococcus sp.]|nr:HAMP domain-containing protein [Ruminococcus sp.]
MLLPVLVLIAIIGGYWITGRILRPIRKISDATAQIEHGNDLKKRIELGNGNDELHQLADAINAMIDRLDQSFETEKRFVSDASHELRTPVSVITA